MTTARALVTRTGDGQSIIRFRAVFGAGRMAAAALGDAAARSVQQIAAGDGLPIRVFSFLTTDRSRGAVPPFAADARTNGYSLLPMPERIGHPTPGS